MVGKSDHVGIGNILFYSLAPQTMTICENAAGILSCPTSTNLVIQSANWGRTAQGVCGSQSVTNCRFDATSKVKQICGGKNYCSLKASLRTLGNDPCHGIAKYLEVQFYCQKGGLDKYRQFMQFK